MNEPTTIEYNAGSTSVFVTTYPGLHHQVVRVAIGNSWANRRVILSPEQCIEVAMILLEQAKLMLEKRNAQG